MSLVVLVPARNEAPRIGSVLRDVARVLPAARILVVDSESDDDTAWQARNAGARVLRGPQGYARALAAGYRSCLEDGFRTLVQLDADGQHPPAAIPLLLEGLADANLVVGSRHGTRAPGPLHRRLGNALLAEAVRAVTGLRLYDVTSGFWAMDHLTLRTFASHFPEDVADANIRVLASRHGIVISERSVRMPLRVGGQSMHDGLGSLMHLGYSLRALAREALLQQRHPGGRVDD